MDVNNDKLITKTDRTAILKNPYYTPCNTAHLITPPM